MKNKLKLVLYPDPILRQACKKITKFDQSLRQIARDMEELMHKENGVGLASPQCGKSIQLIICYDPEGKKTYALCNPEILSKEGSIEREEGCLSYPGTWIKVNRPEAVKVKYHDLTGKVRILKAKGVLAQACCHEYEHLHSILLSDSKEKKITGEDNV